MAATVSAACLTAIWRRSITVSLRSRTVQSWGADAYGPPKDGDVLALGVLEQGFRLDDAQIIVKTAMSSGITADVGFAYADGADDAHVPQDAAYFASGADFASAGRIRCQSAKLVTLPKQALLTVTLKGAENKKAADIDILIYGEKFGQL